MDKLTGECAFPGVEKVIFGPGRVAAVGPELERLGGRRTLLATGRTLARSPLLETVKAAMGGRCVGVFEDMVQHGAADSAEAMATAMRRLDVDSVVTFGGSTVTDSGKVAIGAVLSGRKVEELASMELFEVTDLGEITRTIPHVGLPTTLSAGEYNPGGGATNRQGLKGAVMHPALKIDVIINDPELTLETGDVLWTSTGIRALDHLVEAFYSQHSQSFTDALAEKGLQLLLEHLPASVRTTGDERIAHRGHCLTAAFLSNYAAINTRYGVSHAVGHKVGPMWDVPHGITSCISLPFAMRFMAARVPERFERMAAALNLPFERASPARGAASCIDRIEAFIDSLGLPRSLSEVGVPGNELNQVIPHIRYEIDLLDALGTSTTDAEVAELLDAMYLPRNSRAPREDPA